jgi:nucleoid-associated protein YgaU
MADQGVSVSAGSRLRFGTIGEIDGIQFFDLVDAPPIPEQPDDLTHQVKGSDRLDRLANRYYGDSVLWWVIAVANNIEIVPTEVSQGDILRIPSPRFVQQQLFRTAKGR